LCRKEHLGAEPQPTDVGHPHRKPEWREQLANALAIVPGKEWRQIIEQRMRDGVELECVATQDRRVGSEDPEALVLPPHVLGSALVVRDAKAPLPIATFEAPVAE
jgi:hypothetical protein